MSTSQDTTPARRAICLVCRTLLPEGGQCAHARHHTVVSLQTDQGRDALRREIWETPWVHRSPSIAWVVSTASIPPVAVGLLWSSSAAAATTALVTWSALAGAALWRRRRQAAGTPPRAVPATCGLPGADSAGAAR